jgi:inosine-uridine nucleoside N-ribohydrolase
MSPTRRLWIDTDTASDDAVAIVMALRHPNTEVVGMSVVIGNVPVEMGVQNALYTAEICGKSIPSFDPSLPRSMSTVLMAWATSGCHLRAVLQQVMMRSTP